jgi:iron uptake system component EfeO
MRRTTLFALAAAAAALLAAGCGSSGASDSKTGGRGQTLAVKLTDEGCSPATLRAKAGAITFQVENGGTGKVTEFELKNEQGIILGERENLVSGISGSFSLRLEPGKYVLSCPNGDTEDQGTLVVSGRASGGRPAVAAATLARATDGYRRYVVREADGLVAATRTFTAALEAGNLVRAKQLFGPVRARYERIEPVAESFGDLDPAIDARIDDVASPAEWTGFHAIERVLWERKTTAGTAPLGRRLLRDVQTLARKARTLDFQPAQLANGAVELLNEVASSKITGEEDRYSHTDLSDFAANVAGARTAFSLLRPALVERGDGQLAGTIATRFTAVEQGIGRYRRPTPLGFALYDALTAADRRALAQQVDALAEPLSTVAAKVSG